MSSNMSTNLAQPSRMFLRYQQNRTHISIEVATARSGLRRAPGIAARAKAAHAQPIVAASTQFQ
jgi:hypothetical protein